MRIPSPALLKLALFPLVTTMVAGPLTPLAVAAVGSEDASDSGAQCQVVLQRLISEARQGRKEEAAKMMGQQNAPVDYGVAAQKAHVDAIFTQLLAVAEALTFKGSTVQQKSDGSEVIGLLAGVEGKQTGLVFGFRKIQGEYRLVDVDEVPLAEIEALARKAAR